MSTDYTRRYNGRGLSDVERAELRELVRTLGVDPGDIAVDFAVSTDAISTQLHLTEYQRDETGFKVYDIAADRPWTRPRVFDVDAEQLPAAVRPAVEGATR